MTTIKIKHKFKYPDNGDYAYSKVSVFDMEGKSLFSQSASEALQECPEDALFYRDLNDPADVISLVEKLGAIAGFDVVVEDEELTHD